MEEFIKFSNLYVTMLFFRVSAHEALLVRQDAELRLMETMKRCLAQKVKCDKDYAISLSTVAQQGLKLDRVDDLQGGLNSYRFESGQLCGIIRPFIVLGP